MSNNGNHRTVHQTIGFIAVVHTPDSVTFTATAGTRDALVERVAEYVATAAQDRLLPADAAQVRRLLARAQLDRAVELYFALVGKRWDKEWLVTAAIGGGMSPTAVALIDGVVDSGWRTTALMPRLVS